MKGNIHEIPRSMRCKNRGKKICVKENNFTRQYLCGSAICLCPQSYKDFIIIKEKYKMRQYSFSLAKIP